MLWITVGTGVERSDIKHKSALSMGTKSCKISCCVCERERERDKDREWGRDRNTKQRRNNYKSPCLSKEITSEINPPCFHDWDQNMSAMQGSMPNDI